MNNVYTLANGVMIPQICYGGGIVHTYRHVDESAFDYLKYKLKTRIKNRKQYELDSNFRKSVHVAMDNGLNFFDTSSAYRDAEHELGESLTKYNREEYFIATKLCNSDQYKGNIRGAMEKSLRDIGVDFIDLYLLHWPVEDIWIDSWKEIEKMYEEGLCRAIGVCNCNIHHLEALNNKANICPMVNEFECHPLFTQDELRQYCKKNNIQVIAYTSTARMDERLRKTILVPISKKYNKSIAQIIMKWHLQIGNIPIFNSRNPEHIKSNTLINDFELTEDEIVQITQININSRLRYDPDNCDFTQL